MGFSHCVRELGVLEGCLADNLPVLTDDAIFLPATDTAGPLRCWNFRLFGTAIRYLYGCYPIISTPPTWTSGTNQALRAMRTCFIHTSLAQGIDN